MKKRDRVVVLDNDETTAYYIPLLQIYTFVFEQKGMVFADPWKRELWKDGKRWKRAVENELIEQIVTSGAMDHYGRPFLKHFLKTLAFWKEKGHLDRVCIFTAASDFFGWVSFLKRLLERYCEQPGLFCNVYTVEKVAPHLSQKTGRKHIDFVTHSASEVIFIDDRGWDVVVTGDVDLGNDFGKGFKRQVQVLQVPPYFLQHDAEVNYAFSQRILQRLCQHPSRIPFYKTDSRLDGVKVRNPKTDRVLLSCLTKIQTAWPDFPAPTFSSTSTSPPKRRSSSPPKRRSSSPPKKGSPSKRGSPSKKSPVYRKV